VNLYLRLLKVLLGLPWLRRRGLFDEARLQFRVWPNDCDINLHMNNGRYLTLMDLGRVQLLAQTGLLRQVLRQRWQLMLVGADINFLRGLSPFERFTLVTRLLTWDEKYFYIEQRFERGQTLCAVAMVKGLILARGGRVVLDDAVAALGLKISAPPLPPVIRQWNDLTALKKQHSARQ
jgi:acyl-CoA thioesterase FadM